MSEYETIKIKKEIKLLLEKILHDYQLKLGRKLGFDELLLRLIIDARARPELFNRIIDDPIENHNTEKALKTLREERRKDSRL